MNAAGKRVLIFVGADYEDLEIWHPKLRLLEAGASVTVAGPQAGVVYPGKHGYPCPSDVAIADVRSEQFDGVLVAGGWMPDALRRDPNVLRLVREFHAAGKLIATICHGPWILISAGICRGFKMTSTPGIKDDVINAGASWVDEPLVVDRHIISSRRPPDLPAFGASMVAFLANSLARK